MRLAPTLSVIQACPSYVQWNRQRLGRTIGADAAVGPFVVIGKNVQIGANARIASHVSIAEGTSIGDNALINAGARIGRNVTIGNDFICQPGAVIGADGFSFVTPEK